MARKKLGEILVQAGVLTEVQLRMALGEQRRWGGPLGRILVDMKLVNEEAMVTALSHQLNFPVIDLDKRKIDPQVLDLIPGELAEQLSVVPFSSQGKFLDVAMSDPTNLGIIDELRIRTRMNVRPYLAGPKMIERALARWYGRGIATVHFGTDGRLGEQPDVGSQPQQPANLRYVDMEGPAQAAPIAPMPQTPSGSAAAARRAQQFEMAAADQSGPVQTPPAVQSAPLPGGRDTQERSREILALQARVQQLEALVQRDEDVLRKLLGLFIEKGLATREEILDRIK